MTGVPYGMLREASGLRAQLCCLISLKKPWIWGCQWSLIRLHECIFESLPVGTFILKLAAHLVLRKLYFILYLHKNNVSFLAHLSQRLRGSIGWQPSSFVVVVHTFKLEYLCSLQADLNQILSLACLWWGIACICILGKLL